MITLYDHREMEEILWFSFTSFLSYYNGIACFCYVLNAEWSKIPSHGQIGYGGWFHNLLRARKIITELVWEHKVRTGHNAQTSRSEFYSYLCTIPYYYGLSLYRFRYETVVKWFQSHIQNADKIYSKLAPGLADSINHVMTWGLPCKILSASVVSQSVYCVKLGK